jgi:hypothetical protein
MPSADEMRAREQVVRNEKGAQASALSLWDRGIRLLVEAAVFMLSGLVVGWRARRA